MKSPFLNREKNFRKKFYLLWFLFCIATVILVVQSEWRTIKTNALSTAKQRTELLAFRINAMFTSIEDSLGTIPFYIEEGPSCSHILPKLESAVLNNLYISGVALSSKKNFIWCTTLKTFKTLPPTGTTGTTARTLFGPLKEPGTSRNFFIISQTFPTFNIHVYILDTIFNTLFRMNSDIFDFMGLYDTNKKHLLYVYGTRKNSTSFSNANQTIAKFIDHNIIQSSIPLYKLNNIHLVTQVQEREAFYQLLKNLMILAIPFTLFFILTYYSGHHFVKKQFSTTRAIKIALGKKQFFPMYQPIYNEINKRFDGAEILIRWKNDFGQTIMPDDFIEDAERSGLIIPMTLALAKTVFLECRDILASHPDFHLGLNLTPHHFRDESFITSLLKEIKKHNIKPHQIMLELTERELFDKKDTKMIEKMHSLRKIGFSLALDDFGTGQANIHYLNHFPFNFLKIDKMFVNAIGTGAITEQLSQGIITMAQSLNLHLIAEGVETEKQRDYLATRGVEFIQGWLYARAMPTEEFLKFIAKNG